MKPVIDHPHHTTRYDTHLGSSFVFFRDKEDFLAMPESFTSSSKVDVSDSSDFKASRRPVRSTTHGVSETVFVNGIITSDRYREPSVNTSHQRSLGSLAPCVASRKIEKSRRFLAVMRGRSRRHTDRHTDKSVRVNEARALFMSGDYAYVRGERDVKVYR
jgi:hypothetical protein